MYTIEIASCDEKLIKDIKKVLLYCRQKNALRYKGYGNASIAGGNFQFYHEQGRQCLLYRDYIDLCSDKTSTGVWTAYFEVQIIPVVPNSEAEATQAFKEITTFVQNITVDLFNRDSKDVFITMSLAIPPDFFSGVIFG